MLAGRWRVGPLFYLEKYRSVGKRCCRMPGPRGYFNGMNWASCIQFHPFEHPAVLVKYQQHRGSPNQLKYFPCVRSRMPVRPDVGAGLDGDKQP